ncbi:Uncharacterised protein [Clostridioides difficile]|nr:Uncharacterised protein [Clostridioides difficile]VHT46314.1 Uncharacterised protein [Clostridioides difficile]
MEKRKNITIIFKLSCFLMLVMVFGCAYLLSGNI